MYRRRLVTLLLFSLALIIQALGPLVLDATKPGHSQVPADCHDLRRKLLARGRG